MIKGNNEIKLTCDSIITTNKSVLVTELDGEVCMMSVDSGKYYGLNSVGSRIWELAQGKISVREVINVLMAEFEVDEETCMEQTISYIKNLVNEGLMIIDN